MRIYWRLVRLTKASKPSNTAYSHHAIHRDTETQRQSISMRPKARIESRKFFISRRRPIVPLFVLEGGT